MRSPNPHAEVALAASLPAATTLSLVVNGEKTMAAAGTTVGDLLSAMALTGKRIAVELNGTIVPRSQHATQVLVEDDRLEIVVAVGGG